MDIAWALLGILAGMLIAVQGPINAQLAQGLGMPLAAAMSSMRMSSNATANPAAAVVSLSASPTGTWRGLIG